MPPWALEELLACSVVLVATATRAPAATADTPAARPEAPLPITSTSKEVAEATVAQVYQATANTSNYSYLSDSGCGRLVRMVSGTLADIVKPNFIEVAPEDTLGEVAERMTAKNVGAVVVKDFGRLIGILTERDLLKAMAARVHTSEARVRQWMTEDPITASPDTPLEEAAQVMLDNGFRHLPVVDDTQVVGVVSLRRVVAQTQAAEFPAA